MVAMSKQKPGPKTNKTPPRRHVLYIQLTPELDAALVRFIAAQRIPPDRSSVGHAAVEELLTREGFWPPPHPKPPAR